MTLKERKGQERKGKDSKGMERTGKDIKTGKQEKPDRTGNDRKG